MQYVGHRLGVSAGGVVRARRAAARSVGEGMVAADEDGLARLVLTAGPGGPGVCGDDERRCLGPRPAGCGRLGGRGRARAQGPRYRAVGVQDRQGRRAGAGRVVPARSRARAVAALARGPCAARAAAAPDASGAAAHLGAQPHLRAADAVGAAPLAHAAARARRDGRCSRARGVPEAWRRSIAEALAVIDLLDARIAPLEPSCARSPPPIRACCCCARSPGSVTCSG